MKILPLLGCILVATTVLRAVPDTCSNAIVPLNVDITRNLTKTLFESNAVPFIQPMVVSINATSNSRFFDGARIPKKVDKPYFRVSVNTMVGFIQDDMKWYTPTLDLGPRVNVGDQLAKYGTLTMVDGKPVYTINPTYSDTLGLATSLMNEIFRDALDSNMLVLPAKAPTLFGYQPDTRVLLPTTDDLMTLLHARPEYKILLATSPSTAAQLDTLVSRLKLNSYLTLPPGANMNVLVAAVPQLEVGSIFGTEIMVRFIPPIEFDKNVGKFAFWGGAIRHSLSQYFPEEWFDMAAQFGYQGTNLKNTVGYTNATLDATATIFNFNLHASKRFWEALDVYSGISYETISVNSIYTYPLPQEIQLQLGLLPPPPSPGAPSSPDPPCYPGDTQPQSSTIHSTAQNIKWTIGATVIVDAFRFSVDYSISQFNVFTAGIKYTL